jgi:hypothetical protein
MKAPRLMALKKVIKVVTPVKTGVQAVCKCLKNLDSGFRRNDGKEAFATFSETIKFILTSWRGTPK